MHFMVASPNNDNHIITTQWITLAASVDPTSGAAAMLHIFNCHTSLVFIHRRAHFSCNSSMRCHKSFCAIVATKKVLTAFTDEVGDVFPLHSAHACSY